MLTSKDLFSIPYYNKGAVFTGSQRDFRFRVEKIAEEDKSPEFKLTIYPDKVCYDLTPDAEKEEIFFPFDNDGLTAIAEAINNHK